MFRIFAAALLATATASAALAHGGSMLGPCGPLSPTSLANPEAFVAPPGAIEPAKHTKKPLRWRRLHG
jgi:hypothetical protein